MLIFSLTTDFPRKFDKRWYEGVGCVVCGMFWKLALDMQVVAFQRRTRTSQHDYIVTILTPRFESGVGRVVTSINYVVTVNYQIDIGWYIPIGERLKAAI
jgi:hypothetical protein